MRIVITGDIQRPEPTQESNIRWLYHLIRHQIRAITGCDPECISDGMKLIPPEWMLSLSKDAKPSPWFVDANLVIGFEMPQSFMTHLELNSIPFIQVICHPVRFMDDLVFGVNFPTTKRLNPLDIHVKAELIKTQLSRLQLNLPEKTSVIIGQTRFDRSVISEGKLLDLSQFEQPILKLENPVFKPHPHATGNMKKFFLKLGIETIHHNIYQLLTSPQVNHFAGISSSCLYEASYFEKKVTFFGPRWADSFVPVHGHDFISVGFWREALDFVGLPTHPVKELNLIREPNRIRRTCNSFWGYDFVLKN